MRKTAAVLLAVLWLIAACTGCSTLAALGAQGVREAASSPPPSAEPGDAASPTPPPTATPEPITELAPTAEPYPTDTAALVGVYRSEQVEYQGKTLTYTVPEILCDCPGAETINAQLREQWDPQLDYALESAAQYYPFYGHIGYECWVTDGVLTIVMDMTHDEGGTGKWAYALDLASGEALDTAQILERAGMAYDDFLQVVRQKMEADFYETQAESFEFSDGTHALEETLSDDNLRRCAAYLDRDGNLQAICTIYTVFAVNTTYTAVFQIDPAEAP